MKLIKCSDLGMKCGFAALGNDAAEAKKKMLDHMAKVHKDMMEHMSPKQKKDMENKMDELLK